MILGDTAAERTISVAAPDGALVDRLLTVIAGLNADLDHDVVLRRICRACVELLRADAAAFLVLESTTARLVAGAGLTVPAVGLTIPIDRGALAGFTENPRRLHIGDLRGVLADRPDVLDAVGGRRTMVVTPVHARSHLVGGLVVLFAEPDHHLDGGATTLLDLLAGHGGAAIANALAFEEAVRRREQEKAVIDAVADGVVTVDARGAVTGWNQAAARLTGIPVDEAVGRTLPFRPGTPDEPAEIRLAGERWIEIVATPLHAGRVVVLRDISRQKALEAAKTVFMAGTSHELKTPLTVIRSFAEWLATEGERHDPARREVAYRTINDSVAELSSIVEKILLTAKTEAGHVDLDLQRTELGRLVRGVAEPFSAPDGRHQVVVGLAPDLPPVRADARAVRTVLGQLLENAVKYSPSGGNIGIGVCPDPEGANVVVVVSDQGIGLAPGEEDFLFLPFYQGETRNRSGVRGGVGLGLSIVRRLVEAQGGAVGASGAPGQGARFWFSLPVYEDEIELPA
jgi:signal transduction histidine kinase